MNYKVILAALVALGLTSPAWAEGEGNNEVFPMSVSVNATTGQVQMSTLPVTSGLPVGALQGTPRYEQAQSVTQWYAQQADHRFAQAAASRTNG